MKTYSQRERLQWQLDNHQIVNKNNYHLLEEKFYHSGKPIKIGDQILKGMLIGAINFYTSLSKEIKFNIKEIDNLYEIPNIEAKIFSRINVQYGIILKYNKRIAGEFYIEN